jgi:hypothetical protein
MQAKVAGFKSTGDVAKLLGVQVWQVARLFELGVVSDCPRIAGRRIIPDSQIAEIAIALRDRGWLAVGDTKGMP